MKFSIIIPLGKFPFFIKILLKNLNEKFLNPDISFVIKNTKCENIEQELDDASIDFKFKIIRTPFDSEDHLELFNWAVANNDFCEWIMIQHCDLFWYDSKWLKPFPKNKTVIVNNEPANFTFNNKNVILLGDFFGLYNNEFMKRHQYTLQRGCVTAKSFSKQLLKAIKNKKVKKNNGKINVNGDFLDGSILFSLEMAVNHPTKILPLNVQKSYHHMIAFFRISESITLLNNTLTIQLPFLQDFGCSAHQWLQAFTKYSYLTSHYCHKEDVKAPLPWNLFKTIIQTENLNIDDSIEFFAFLKPYLIEIENDSKIGNKNLNVKKIVFNNINYDTKISIL